MELPVFSLCENMLMQIDANDVVLYMQISHAATLWLLFFRDRRTLMSVCLWMLMSTSSCLGVCLGCLCENGYKCNQYPVSYKFKSLCFLQCMTHFWEWETLLRGLRMQSSKASDFWSLLLRNPNIVWLFLSLSALFDSRQERVHRRGKWVAAKSVLHGESQKGRAEVALNLTECSRYPRANREWGRQGSEKCILFTRTYSYLQFCVAKKVCVTCTYWALMYCAVHGIASDLLQLFWSSFISLLLFIPLSPPSVSRWKNQEVCA